MPESVGDLLLLSDASTIAAIKLLHHHLGLVVEPSGAVGVAAILEDRARFKDQLVATIITGSNLTPEQMRQWLA